MFQLFGTSARYSSREAPTPPPCLSRSLFLGRLRRQRFLYEKLTRSLFCAFGTDSFPAWGNLVLEADPPQATWEGQIRSAIRPAAGKLKTVALAQLFRNHGIGGQRWLRLFANGFPITGDLSQLDCFPASEKKVPARISCSELSRSDAPRFRERAAKSSKKTSLQLWAEAAGQVGKSWLAPPAPPSYGRSSSQLEVEGFHLSFSLRGEESCESSGAW